MNSLALGDYFRHTASQMRTVVDHFDQHLQCYCTPHIARNVDTGVIADAADRFERQQATIEAAQSPIEVVALCNTTTVSMVSLEPQWLGDKACKSLGRQLEKVRIRWTGIFYHMAGPSLENVKSHMQPEAKARQPYFVSRPSLMS